MHMPTRLPACSPALRPALPLLYTRSRSAWIVIDDHAKRSFLHADKRTLIYQLGINIPIRDMRLLDFNLLSSGAARRGRARRQAVCGVAGIGCGALGGRGHPSVHAACHLLTLFCCGCCHQT